MQYNLLLYFNNNTNKGQIADVAIRPLFFVVADRIRLSEFYFFGNISFKFYDGYSDLLH